jgi:hypothetical protein
MYWDSLTAAGVLVSLLLLVGVFYLLLRTRPRHYLELRKT